MGEHTVLTPRQWETLYGAARGEQAIDTANRLGIALNTAKEHRKAVLERLGARNMAHAVGIACHNGWIP